jgi:CelD/BcsL family acetyltransferase involved in cellulose biosynthesis
MTATLTLASGAAVPDLQGTWDRLALETRSVFATPVWAETWWRHLGPAAPMPLPVAVRDAASSVVALVPVYTYRRRPVRVVRLVGHGPGDLLGPVSDPEHVAAAPILLRRALDMVGWDVFVGDVLSGGADWESELEIRLARPTGSPVLPLRGIAWEDVLGGMSSNARQQVRRRERNLHRAFKVTFRLADDPAVLERDLDTLFELHGRRWGGVGTEFSRHHAAFHRAFAREAVERGWLRMWFLYLDGVPAAAWHGFRFAGVESYYQAGWDPAYARYSVAGVLLAHTIRAAAEDGVDEYRLLRGEEAYKYRFASLDEGLVSLVAVNGRRGGIATAAGLRTGRYLRSASASIRLARFPVRKERRP